MATNDRRIIELIMKHCNEIDERAPGYRRALLDHVADILMAERRNKLQKTNIQQEVTGKCEALGLFLAQQRGADLQDAD